MALSVKLTAALSAVQTGANDFGVPEFSPNIAYLIDLASGTGAGQADQLWMDERTIASSGQDLITMTALVDAFGATVPFAKLAGVLVINAPRVGPANTTNLTFGGTGSTFVGITSAANQQITPIRPGSFIYFGTQDIAGLGPVVAATTDILRIANSAGAAATYQIILIGKSA